MLAPIIQEDPMPTFTILIVVLTVWGVGAAAGSASEYLIGAVVGVAAALVLFAISGAVSAWRNPTQRDQTLKPY